SSRVTRGEHVESFQAVFHSSVIKCLAHDDFRGAVMDAVVEEKLRVFARRANGPAGKAIGHLNYVCLRVTAVHADCVEFHHFAAVIFIEAALLFFGRTLRRLSIWETSCLRELTRRGRLHAHKQALKALAAESEFLLHVLESNRV